MYGNDDQINSEAAGQLAAKVAMLAVTVDAAIDPAASLIPMDWITRPTVPVASLR